MDGCTIVIYQSLHTILTRCDLLLLTKWYTLLIINDLLFHFTYIIILFLLFFHNNAKFPDRNIYNNMIRNKIHFTFSLLQQTNKIIATKDII